MSKPMTAIEIQARMADYYERNGDRIRATYKYIIGPLLTKVYEIVCDQQIRENAKMITKYLYAYAGRDMCRMMDVGIFIGLFPIDDPKKVPAGSLIRFRWSLSTGWNWKPRFFRIPRRKFSWTQAKLLEKVPYFGSCEVGRWPYWQIVGYEWPFYFRMKLLRGITNE